MIRSYLFPVVALVSVMAWGNSASAFYCGLPIPCAGHPDGNCSFTPQTNNLEQTDAQLSTLAHSTRFADASLLRAAVSEISAIDDPVAKTAAYYALVGVATSAERAAFLTARDRATYEKNLADRLLLSKTQSTLAVRVLRDALLNGGQSKSSSSGL